MPTRHRVRCIHRADGTEPHARIHAIGGANRDGSAWKLALADAIGGIEAGRWVFYLATETGGRRELEVAVDREGRRYLRAAGDDDELSGLLALPECP